MADSNNDVEAFRLWATSLGCPPEAIPNENALKAVFKSPQDDFFRSMMKRVRPRQEVEAFRRHILLKEVQKLGGKEQLMLIPASQRVFLPQKLQIFCKQEDLKKKYEESEARLNEYKKEYDTLAASLKLKNIQIIKAKQRNNVLNAKVDLLHLKSKSLKADIKKEEEHKAQLIKYMPVKLSSNNASGIEPKLIVEQALKALDKFYDFHRKNSNPMSFQSAKEDLWSKFRNLFSNLPNCLLFDEIMLLKDQQLQTVMAMNKKKLTDSNLRNLSMKEPMSTFEKELMKTKIDFLALVVKQREADQENDKIEESFCNRCELFMTELRKQVCEFNTDENEDRIDEVLSDYVMQYNLRIFYRNQNELMQQDIDKYRNEIESNAKKLKNHEVLISTVKQTYSDINAIINTVQRDMMQLSQIKQKIIFSRDLLKQKVNDQLRTISSSKLMSTTSYAANTADSFGSGTESLLCSTQLDLDVSTNTSLNIMKRTFVFGDTPLMASTEAHSLLPPHALELSIFNDIPFEKFNCIGKDCAFYLSPNPLVIESCKLSSTLQLAPGTLLTQNAALQEVRNRIAWAELIAKHTTDLKLDLDQHLTMVEVESYKNRSKIQHDKLSELLDKIEIKGIYTSRKLKKAEEIYKFILDNPLRLYIPASKLFNNQKYSDFEAEYKMFYRMATGDLSIK